MIAGFVRGLSTRDVEATLAEALGGAGRPVAFDSEPDLLPARPGVHRLAGPQPGRGRVGLPVPGRDLLPVPPRRPCRAGPGRLRVTTTGGPVFLGLAPSASDGHDPWIDFLADLTGRGLRSPVLVITDGAPGLLSAVEQAFPAALRQRCLVHRVRNVLAKGQPVPRLRSRPPTGPSSTTSTGRQARPPETRPPAAHRRSPPATSAPPPAAVACLNSPLDDLTVHLRFPREHRQRIRHTNLLERTFGETRRRTKVIGRLPAERSCLTLVGPSWTARARAGAG